VYPSSLLGVLQTREVALSILCLPHKTFILSFVIRGDNIKENNLLKSCNTNGVEETILGVKNFSWKFGKKEIIWNFQA
jgi:hypothetical protein